MSELNESTNVPIKKTQSYPVEFQTSFYYSLRMYSPLFYSGKGVPTFLILKNGSLSSLPCLIFINILAIMVIVLSFTSEGSSSNSEEVTLFKNINMLVLLFIDIFYLLTISLNPGIIAQEHLELAQGQNYNFCNRCNQRTNSNMKHCIQCGICVEDLDHHCSFFGKCIAGVQRFAFYGFLTFLFVGFLTMLGNLSILFSPS